MSVEVEYAGLNVPVPGTEYPVFLITSTTYFVR